MDKIQSVINLPALDRYMYFIRKVADFEEVWGLYDDGWALLGDDKNKILAFWPESEFAKICANGIWGNYQPKKITLGDFTEKWLGGMIKDGVMAAIFYTPNGKGLIISAKQLSDDLNRELAQFE